MTLTLGRIARPGRAVGTMIAVAAIAVGSVACTSAPSRTSSGPTSRAPATSSPAQTPPSSPVPDSGSPSTSRPSPAPSSTIGSGTLRPSGSVQVLDCKGGQPSAFPVSLILTCADGGITMIDIVWSTWTASSARGAGSLRENSCTPTCAQGTFVNHPATITLSAPTPFDGTTLFTRASIRSRDASVPPVDQVLPN